MSIEAMKQALEALENSVDLVVEEARQAQELYGKYPTRQARVQGLQELAEAHQAAIAALRQAIEQSEQARSDYRDWGYQDQLDKQAEHMIDCPRCWLNFLQGRRSVKEAA